MHPTESNRFAPHTNEGLLPTLFAEPSPAISGLRPRFCVAFAFRTARLRYGDSRYAPLGKTEKRNFLRRRDACIVIRSSARFERDPTLPSESCVGYCGEAIRACGVF